MPGTVGTPGVEPTVGNTTGGYSGGGAWGAAAQLVGTAADIYFTNRMNQQMMNWNEDMYGRQRQDALDDWNRMNAYNSPQAQLARLKAAGLNPNLVYGTGATANTSTGVRSTDVKGWQPNKLPIGDLAGNAITTYQNLALGQEQVRNLQQQRKNMEVDNTLKTMEIANKGIKTAQSAFDLQQSKDLKDTTIAKANALARGAELANVVKMSKETRDVAMSTPKLAEAFQKVAQGELKQKLSEAQIQQVHAQIDALKKKGVLDDLEIAMRNVGMTYADPLWMRMLAQFADGKPLPDVVREAWDWIHRGFDGASPASILQKIAPLKGDSFGPGSAAKWYEKYRSKLNR